MRAIRPSNRSRMSQGPVRRRTAPVVARWCLLSAVLPAAAWGEPPPRFTRLSVEDGLSQGTVQAILQDHVGFLWFGTEEGLNRFDGYSFRVFRHDPKDPRSLPDSMISALHEDRQKRLWVGTQNGLAALDRETETFVRVPSVRERVSTIVEDPDGTLWIGSVGEGVFRRDAVSGVFVQHTPDPRNPASLASHMVSVLHRDRQGRLWIGTRDAGLDLIEDVGGADRPAAERRFVHHRHDPRDARSLPHNDVLGLVEDGSGNIWVATNGGGLSALDPKTRLFRRHRAAGSDRGADLLTRLLMDGSGVLWIGSGGAGVQRYEPASNRSFTYRHGPADPRSLSSNVVRSIYEDAAGQIWVGTENGGVNLLKRAHHAFTYVTHSPGDASSLADAGVASFLEDARGRIWVGTEGGWLHRFEPQSGALLRYRFPSAKMGGAAVLSLAQDRRGRIWAGTYRGGLGQFDPERGTFTIYAHRPGDPRGSVDDSIWAISVEEDGALWLGTNTGLVRFDPEQGESTLHHETYTPGGLTYTGVRALLRDRQGNLWVGTLGGLNVRLRGGAGFVRYRHDERDPHSLSSGAVMALHEDRQGHVWVGTLGGGVNRLDPAAGTFTTYRDFPSSAVYRIEEASAGRLWLSTNHGLSRLDPATGRVENFDLTSGLQSLQFHLGASLRTRGGRLMFGSANGFYHFDPDSIRPAVSAPPVVLTYMRPIGDPRSQPIPISTRAEVAVRPDDSAFSLEFAAMDHAVPRRNQYAYRMDGLTGEWIELGARREVTFTNLDPGSYVFRVKASNSDGVWGPASAALRIVVAPPFWHTWWFRGLLAAAVALAVVLVHRLRVRQLTARLEERGRTELALRQAEWKYRSIVEQVVEGVFQSTLDGRFLAANPALAQMFGYASPQELLAEVTDIETQVFVRPHRRQELRRLLEEFGVVRDFQYEARRRGGGTFWISANVRAVRDEAGNTVYFGTAEDISDRKRAEETEKALREILANARLEWQRTFDAIEAYVFILDEHGIVRRINQAVRDGAHRPTYGDCLGHPVTELGAGEPWRTARELAREVAYTASASQAQVEDVTTRRTWDLRATPIQGVDAGDARTIVVARDVTSTLERERSLVR